MKRFLLIAVFFLAFHYGNAQVTEEFRRKFEQVRLYMQEFQYEKASPVLLDLLEKDPKNANLQFLLGVCFTMGPVVDNRSITLLENAKQEIADEYNARSPDERKVPDNVYFYLAVAYAQSFNFEAANAANDHYHELTGTINGKYLRDAKLWIDKMAELKDMLATEPIESFDDTYGWGDDEGFVPAAAIDSTIVSEEVFKEKVQAIEEQKEADKNLAAQQGQAGQAGQQGQAGDGSTKFYGVQIGAFANSIPSYIFSGTENVKAYKGKEGYVRFVVGSVTTREEAEVIRDKMRRTGYADAFIVHLDREDFVKEIK